MKPLFSAFLLGALFVVFTLITGCGVYLIARSVDLDPQGSAHQDDRQSKVDLGVTTRGVRIKISTAIPGLVVFVMGGLGLLLLTIRVPVKQIRGYKKPPKPPKDSSGYAPLQYMQVPEPILSDKTERVPLLLWWLIRDRGLAVRVEA